MLPSLRWSRAVQLVTAKRKNGAGADDSRRRRERRRRERLLFFSLLSVFFSSPVFCSFHLSSLASTNPTLSFPGSAGGCSRCCWWRWRRRNSGGAQGGEDGSSSSLCRDRSLCFSSPRLFSLSLCFFLFLQLASLFSLKKKKSSPLFFLSPIFIGSRGRGSPYLVQVQGMVVWDGSCVAAAGHGLPLPSSWWQGMVGYG